MREELRAQFLLALQFLTRLPVGGPEDYSPERLRRSPAFYPAVGAAIGVVAGVLAWGLALVFPPVVAVILSTLAGLLITGGLHEDGLADLCDGLGSGQSRDRALEIMRDSRLGTHGVLALLMVLGGKVAVLAALPVWALPAVLIAGHSACRASMLVVMATSDYVRAEGAGSGVSGRMTGPLLHVAVLTTVAALLPLLVLAPLALLGGVLGLVFAHAALRQRFEARLGGYTGDCLGATQQLSEIGLYLGVLALI